MKLFDFLLVNRLIAGRHVYKFSEKIINFPLCCCHAKFFASQKSWRTLIISSKRVTIFFDFFRTRRPYWGLSIAVLWKNLNQVRLCYIDSKLPAFCIFFFFFTLVFLSKKTTWNLINSCVWMKLFDFGGSRGASASARVLKKMDNGKDP
jgi:hypothetical protein